MITTDLLREKIKDLAVSGRLTSSFSTTNFAKEQLEEMSGKEFNGEPTDNFPFKIKASWIWVRLENLGDTIKNAFADGPFGSSLKKEHYTTDHQVRIIQLSNVGLLGWKNENEKYTTYEHLETIKRSEVKSGNIVIAKMMPAGRAIIVPDISDAYVLSSDCVKYVPLKGLNVRYLYYAINSQMFKNQVMQDVHGIGRERTSLSKLKSYYLPIPTVEEQELIVKKVDSAYELILQIERLQEDYSSDLEILKSKVIDAGIQGKLTEQLPEDGNAEDLYEAIQEEKQKLIKEKKLKKTKALPEIAEDEIPFEIPENWKWVRIGELFTLQAGKNIPAGSIKESPDDVNIYPCYGGNGLRGYVSNSNVSGKHAIIGRQGALCGNINFAEADFYATEHAVVVYQYADVNVDWIGITLRALNLNQYATSVAQPGLAVSRIDKVLIPLPPLAEQERIVEKVLAIESMI